jgi:hypothetical protein
MTHTYENKCKPRLGKTKRDHKTGAWAVRFTNRDSRMSWQHDRNATTGNFPYSSCNGKKNRTVITGRGNQRVTFTYR